MKFIEAPVSKNFDVYRMLSYTGQWEIGIRRMIFGFRVCGNRVGGWSHAFDYCAGANAAFLAELLATMIAVMSHLPEEISDQEVVELLPSWQVRPIDQDPCWEKLQELAINGKNQEEG